MLQRLSQATAARLRQLKHKPTSIFRRSARRPNPGRGSTYRRGIFVQTTGTSSVKTNSFKASRGDHKFGSCLYVLSVKDICTMIVSRIAVLFARFMHNEVEAAVSSLQASLRHIVIFGRWRVI